MSRRSLPLGSQRALRLLVADGRARETIAGDLTEIHAERLVELGPARAVLRLWRDLFSLLAARGALVRVGGARPFGSSNRPEPMNLVHDLRIAVRTLARTPAYAAVIVLTLALAIGANSAIFGVVDGVLLRPLPFAEPERLYLLRELGPGDASEEGPIASQALFLGWRDSGRALDGIAMYSASDATLTGLAEPARVSGASVSPALFPLLRAEAVVGRTFGPDEELPGRDGVILLAHRTWQRYFGGDPAIRGRSIRIDDDLRTVVGVMGPEFRFPDAEAEYWIPMLASLPGESGEGEPETAARSGAQVRRSVEVRSGAPGGDGPEPGSGGAAQSTLELWGRVIVRLADGVTPEMAAEEGRRILAGVRPPDRGLAQAPDVELRSLLDQQVGSVREPLLILMGAVGFVLLIACANVVNLVMARSLGRGKETAVRSSLGAGWWSLARFLFLESALLAALGAALGLALAWGGLRLLVAAGPDFIPRLDSIAIDLRVLAFTAGVTMLTALFTSLAPLRHAARLDLTRALRDDGAHAGSALGAGGTRHVLVLVQTAAAVVMLVGAGLLVASFLLLTSVDHGYRPEGLLHVQMQLPQGAYPDAVSHLDAYDGVVARLAGLGSVVDATVASRMPSQPANIRLAIQTRAADGTPEDDVPPQPVGIRLVENGYFEAVGAELLEGRFLNADDRAETTPVMVLSESAAAALFGGGRALGERLRLMSDEAEVVGIVRDVRTAGVDPTPQPDVFLPYRQAPARMIPMLFRVANLLVRSEGDVLAAAPAVRQVLAQASADAVVLSVVPVRDTLAAAVAEPRFYASLVGAFALLALVLAAVGIYGLLAYSVQQGMRDTAIRRALGAPGERILRRVLFRGVAVAAAGLAIGIGVSLALGRLLASMLYEIEPDSPGAIGAVALVFLLVAVAAVWIPARRAARIDPMEVLRRAEG